MTYWQHIRSRRNSEERLQYPMRSENYRYSLQQETQMRPRLVEQGFCEALLDEGYASYVRGDIYEARRATNNHNAVVLEAVRCWVRDWKNRNPNASAVKRDESVDREAVAELLDW